MDDPCRVRPARAAEAATLAAIERRCFSDPWSATSFREALATPWTCTLVAERAGEVVGYFIGREAAGSGEVLNLAVDPDHRRHGVARALLEAGLDLLTRRGAEEVFLEVRESNLAAQALYREYGFRPVGQRAGYYRNPKEDALVLRAGAPALRQKGQSGVS
ncbi:MAG TPA: ribosomal protein S18-alanine N-acetyltransferase [Gemmatimonadales bacterium]|nr:ribosomal protein S18-alanine N-acetyltransferase [Gemmatimonadales bacterium]